MAEYQQQTTVTTSIVNMWDASGSQLRISGNGSGLGVSIWVPQVGPDGSRKYPTENRFNCILSQRNVLVLASLLNDYIVPAYEKGEEARKSLFTNSARTTMLEVEVKNGEFYVSLYLQCDPTTRIPGSKVQFKFDFVMAIDTYDSTTGEITGVPIQADFFIFAKTVNSYSDFVGGAISGHGNRVTNQFRSTEFMNYLKGIATAVHAQLPAPSYQPRGNYNPGGGYGGGDTNNPANPNVNAPTPAMSEIDSLESIM